MELVQLPELIRRRNVGCVDTPVSDCSKAFLACLQRGHKSEVISCVGGSVFSKSVSPLNYLEILTKNWTVYQ